MVERSDSRFSAAANMQSDLNHDRDDRIMQLLSRGKRAKALLLVYRSGVTDLSEAWRMINELGDDARFEKPSQDFAFLKVEQYLAGKDPWKEKAVFYGAALLVILLGVGLAAHAWPRLKKGLDSYWWPSCQATILNVRLHEETSYEQDREVTREFLSYRYEYRLLGRTYRQSIVKRAFYRTFGDKVYEIGEAIEVFYNPQDHSETIHKRYMYQRSLRVVVGSVIALIGSGFLGLFLMMDWTHYSLGRIDPLRNNNAAH